MASKKTVNFKTKGTSVPTVYCAGGSQEPSKLEPSNPDGYGRNWGMCPACKRWNVLNAENLVVQHGIPFP